MQSAWIEILPDNVASAVFSSPAGVLIPKSISDWRCHYSFTDASDMEVTGFCAAGPADGYLFVIADASDFQTLVAVVAATSVSLPSTTLPVVAVDETTTGVLRYLGIDVSHFSRSDDAGNGTGSDEAGLHDAPRVVRSMPLAGNEEGEEA